MVAHTAGASWHTALFISSSPFPSPLSSKIPHQNQAAAFGEGAASGWMSHGKYSGMSLLFLRDVMRDHASKSIALYFSVSNSSQKEPRKLTNTRPRPQRRTRRRSRAQTVHAMSDIVVTATQTRHASFASSVSRNFLTSPNARWVALSIG